MARMLHAPPSQGGLSPLYSSNWGTRQLPEAPLSPTKRSDMALRVSPRSPFEEYKVGQILNLKPDDLHHSPPSSPSAPILVRIRKLHSQTLSFTMIVDVLDSTTVPPSSSPAFLKLFDRRFAAQHRRDNGVEPWTCEVEEA